MTNEKIHFKDAIKKEGGQEFVSLQNEYIRMLKEKSAAVQIYVKARLDFNSHGKDSAIIAEHDRIMAALGEHPDVKLYQQISGE